MGYNVRKMFFMHIPKCGGTSVKNALAKGYEHKKIFSLDAHASKYVTDAVPQLKGLDQFRDGLMLYALATDKYNLIMGHSVFNSLMLRNFSKDYGLVSLVREPVSRFCSHYFYNANKESDHFKVNDELDLFLESEVAKKFGKYYVRYFSGVGSKQTVEKAMDNLKNFDVVGTLENLQGFAVQISDKFKIQIQLRHDNKNPVSDLEMQSRLTSEQLGIIKSLCADDIEIYNEVKRFFNIESVIGVAR
jgi:hypothetical protein